jgi:hypothetical protein
MILCTRCGFQNEDTDTFCGSCAGFLEWSGEKVAQEAPEAPEPAPVPTPAPEVTPEPAAPTGFIERVKDRMGTSDGGPADGAATAGGPGPEHGPAGPAGPDVPAAEAPTPAAGVPVATAAAQPTPSPGSVPPAGPVAPGAAVPGPSGPAASAPSPEGPVATAAVAPAPAPSAVHEPTGGPAAPIATGAAVGATVAAAATGSAVASPPESSRPVAGVARTTSSPQGTGPTAPVAPSATTGATPRAEPTALQPEAVKPAATRARPATRAKPAQNREVNPGDLVCAGCGEGNDPSRRFCRRCGASLQSAAVFVATLPWYRRLWLKLFPPKTLVAGERPRTRRSAIGGAGPGWLTSWGKRIILAAVVVLVLLAFVGPWSHSIRHSVSHDYHAIANDVHPTYTPLHPVAATATSQAPSHQAILAIDGATNTCWQTDAPNNGVGQSLIIRFATPTNVNKVGFLNGDQDTPQAYLTEARPEQIRIASPGPHPYSRVVTLKDVASFQTFTIDATRTSSLVITINSVYPSDQGTNAAIAEVELFVKS